MIDLHIHTNSSDGSLSPSKVVRLARQADLEAIGITDHDSIDGIGEFMGECRSAGIEGVAGIEIGVKYRLVTMHLLGYFIDPEAVSLGALLGRVKSERVHRIKKVVEKLNGIGVPLDLDEVNQVAGDSPPGRPHVALALKRKGSVESVEEAFSQYLEKGREAFVERYKPTFDEAKRAIEQAGGISVLAHPISIGADCDSLFDLLRKFSGDGLSGVEVYHPNQDEDFQKMLLGMAKKLSLAVTGGSDFHGEAKPEWRIGVGLGDMRIPYVLLGELRKRLERKNSN
ncbi:MAG: PHP domain-containing protein [Candidatus Glassbacteria bacterium]